MSPLDIIELPGQPGKHGRRAFVEAWQAAGSPPVNSAGRLYGLQKHFYDGWVNRLPGFNPADNPDDERQRLAHVRFVAGDIDPTPERVRRLAAAGLIRPYAYEPWHWELPNVRSYAIVRTIPTTARPAPASQSEEDDMKLIRWNEGHVFGIDDGKVFYVPTPAQLAELEAIHGQARNVGNDGLTAELLSQGLHWDAVDAVLRKAGPGSDGYYWSRPMAEGIAIRGDIAKTQKTLADVIATAARVPGTEATAG